MLDSLHNSGLGFCKDRGGSVATSFALVLIPIVIGIGAAIDYSRANSVKAAMQTALDSAVLAGGQDNTANWTDVALNAFNGNFRPQGSTAANPTFTLNGDGSFSGSASATVPTTILGIMGIDTVNVGAQSTAMVAPTSPNEQYCVLALNLTAPQAVQVSGNGAITITAPNCVLQVNSQSSTALYVNGNGAVNTGGNCVVGGVRGVGNSTVSPPPYPICKTVPDPFANYPRPTVGACDYTNFSLSGNEAMTLQPGVYCGGMSFSGPVDVTFAPGLYIVKDGPITETGGSFTGNGVSFFLTGQSAGIAMSGQANWHLVASSGGPLAGFVFFLDPSAAASTSQLSGQSELYLEGVIYLPHQLLKITGTAQAFSPSPWTSFVADTVQISGNGQLLINNDTSLASVPIPVGLQMRSGGQLWLTH
jgi:Flp pilus assembly protein TadG